MLKSVPWWGKVGAKLVLARLPFEYRTWQKLNIFRHGQMNLGAYALGVFRMHAGYAKLDGKLANKTILELGPGDGIATTLIAAAHGARAILLDTGAYAHAEMDGLRVLEEHLRTAGLSPPPLASCRSLDEVFATCGAQYFTQGLASFGTLATGSVDWIFSQSVLEHVRRRDFADTLAECRRVLAPGGSFTNHVDLKDHLGGALNNLRFSEQLWESDFFANSGFYTNRIRYAEMLEMFRAAGFDVQVTKTFTWPELPTPRTRLDPMFRSIPDEELRISAFDVLLR